MKIKTKLPMEVVKLADQTLTKLNALDQKLFDTFKEAFYNAHLNTVSFIVYYELTDLLFYSITGEKSFNKFYDRFDAPAVRHGRPIAWSTRFIPDLIRDELLSNKTTEEKVALVTDMYKQCRKLERNHAKT